MFLASLKKLLFKAGAAGEKSPRALRHLIWHAGGIALAAGIAPVLLWPEAVSPPLP